MAHSYAYRSKRDSSDSSSDESEKDFCDWKRTSRNGDQNQTLEEKSVVEPMAEPIQISEPSVSVVLGQKRKRNNIWCDVLEDQIISETLGHCGLKKKPKGYGSRGEESYDYTLRYKDKRNLEELDDGHMSADDISAENRENSVASSDSKHSRGNRYVKLDAAGIEAAKKIVQALKEKKQYLIFRVVKFVGIEKAMTLLKMTEQIEESGGMMIKNNARRRTPGGVYFQLLKSDKDITKEMIDKIFEEEESSFEMKKKYDEKRMKRNRFHNKNKKRFRKFNKNSKENKQDNEEEQLMAVDNVTNDPDIVKIDDEQSPTNTVAGKDANTSPSSLGDNEIGE